MPKKKPSKADPFAVWGPPPSGMLHGMSDKQIAQLRAYVSKVTSTAYNLAHDLGYDNGLVEAYTKVAMHATVALKDERDRMFKARSR